MRIFRQAVAAAVVFTMSISAVASAQTPNRAQFEAAVEANHDATVRKLQEWVAFPTIAAENLNPTEGAEYMRRLALDAGFQQAQIVPTDGLPGVFATLDAGAPTTIGVYFMYDVKQFDPAEWSSPPLEGRIIDRPEGKVMMGRGAVNQKGPEMAFLAALKAFKDTGRTPPVNVVLIAEGEEEIGSPNFHQITSRPEVQAALRDSVGVFIPFAGQTPSGATSINLGAKGVVELQLISSGEQWDRGPAKDIHSSLASNVDSPAWRLVKALDTLVADDGYTPAIDGWFENVKPLTERQKQLIAQGVATMDEAELKRSLGIERWIADEDFLTSWLRRSSQPTVNIQGLVSGYTGPGGKTILPGRAEAKLDLRLVPDMTKEEAVAKLNAHLARRGFDDIIVNVSGGYGPTQTDENSLLVRAQAATYRRAGIEFAIEPRLAGSWPGVLFTGAPLNLPATTLGIGRGGAQHAPDEWYLIESSNPQVAGIDETALFYIDYMYELAALARQEQR